MACWQLHCKPRSCGVDVVRAGGDDSGVTARQSCPQRSADAAAPHSHVSVWDLVKKEALSRGDVRVHSPGSTEADFIGSLGNPSSLCSACLSPSLPSQIGTVAESLPFQVGRDAFTISAFRTWPTFMWGVLANLLLLSICPVFLLSEGHHWCPLARI